VKTEAVVCDFSCRTLADTTCALCNKDGCAKHLPMVLSLDFGVGGNTPNRRALAICESCIMRFRKLPTFDAELTAALKVLLAEVKARLAEQALDESPVRQ
jgi:hypothetical protein